MAMLRCKKCGFSRAEFRGWAFTKSSCSGIREGYKAMLHDWELIKHKKK